jgi:MtN3 and saliva related transmembrane protein
MTATGTAIGWVSAIVLLATMIKQVHTQMNQRETKGQSKWLFIGQLFSSSGFLYYSYVVENWVFVTSNILMIVVSIFGQVIFIKNKNKA